MTMTPTNSSQSLTNKNLYWWAAAMDHIEDNFAFIGINSYILKVT